MGTYYRTKNPTTSHRCRIVKKFQLVYPSLPR